MVIDPATESGARVTARLNEDLVAWLVTVAPDGRPVPTPVWFLWDGASLVLYSQRDKPKLRHIAANPTVALALRTDAYGDDIVVVTGEASVDPSQPPADQVPAYVEKYRDAITHLGTEPGPFAAEYSVPIRIRPTKVRDWQAGG